MAGRSCWRLLAACSLIFVPSIFVASIFVSPTFLRGRDAADRSPVLAPDPVPNLVSNLAPQRHSPPTAPVWIPPAGLPQPYPVGRDPHAPAPAFSRYWFGPPGSSSQVVSHPSDAPPHPS